MQWAVLIAGTALFVTALEAIQLRAALLLGAMIAAIVVAVHEGRPRIPAAPYQFAQAIIGCLVARSIDPGIVTTIVRQWPVFVVSIAAVIAVSIGLGGLLARWKVMPGATAVWGSAPGASSMMAVMSGSFGGDPRLVAFMQFLRVIYVALAASLVARLFVPAAAHVQDTVIWFPPVEAGSFAGTLAIAIGGILVGSVLRIPAGALLIPLGMGTVLEASGIVTITLPPWLLAGCYMVIGWHIGLHFTLGIVMHAARSFLKVSASIIVLLATCGGIAYLVHLATGIDALTAYLATSPGGIDSIAIIAASTKVDLPFIMAMQTGRFLVVLFIAPTLARMVSRWVVDADCVKTT